MVNRIVNIFVFLASLVMLLSGADLAYHHYYHAKLVSHTSQPIRIGQQFNLPDVLGKKALVLELRSTCPHCIANEATYRRLSTLPAIQQGRIRIFTVMVDSSSKTALEFLVQAGLPTNPDQLRILSPVQAAKVSFLLGTGTPNLCLLDSTGKVLQSWLGELHGEDEQDLLNALQ